jgi:hypothetical protein
MYTTQTDAYCQNREPIVASGSLTTAETQLSAFAAESSAVGFAVKCSGAWFVGKAGKVTYPVAANVALEIPSKTLAGWYAKSAAGTIALTLIGAGRIRETVA